MQLVICNNLLNMLASIPQHLAEPIALWLLGILVHLGLFIRGEWHL